MRTEIPIFRQIQRDTQLPFRAYQVWLAAVDLLDVVDWRDLKHIEIENALHLHRTTILRALNTLVENGYLCRRDEQQGVVAMYRVPISKGESLRETENPQRPELVETPDVSTKSSGRITRPRTISRGVL